MVDSTISLKICSTAGSGTVDASVVVGVLGAALALEFVDLSGWCQVKVLPCKIEINYSPV